MGTAARRGRRRVRRTQLDLALRRDKHGQLRGVGKRRKRRSAAPYGRPPRDPARPSERHQVRAEVNRRHPQHVTLRVVGEVGYLRKRHMYKPVREALVAVLKRDDFRIVHFSIQGNHIHLVCEAENKLALAAGVKAFESSAGQRINRVISRRTGTRRRGAVFADRYHVRPITSVRETRHCLAYVLNNFRHHGLEGPSLFDGKLDYFSSAVLFPGWKERTTPTIHIPPDYERPLVKDPETWLLAEGWKRSKPISVFEIPGGSRSPI